MEKERLDFLANQVFTASLEVHKNLGPGLTETVYESALVKEFEIRDIPAIQQVKTPLFYKGFELGESFFIDLLVENEVIVQVKSCEGGLDPVHKAQLLSFLKLANKKLGFLINFNVPLLKEGFERVAYKY